MIENAGYVWTVAVFGEKSLGVSKVPGYVWTVHFKLCTFDNGGMTPSKRHVFRIIFALFFFLQNRFLETKMEIKILMILMIIERQ